MLLNEIDLEIAKAHYRDLAAQIRADRLVQASRAAVSARPVAPSLIARLRATIVRVLPIGTARGKSIATA